jgi:hypothetical protein
MKKIENNTVIIEMATDPVIQDGKIIIPGKVKSAAVRIGGRIIPLRYGMTVQEQVDEELEMDFYELQGKLDKGKRNTKETIKIIRMMGNDGLRKAGKEADLTDEWLRENMQPSEIINYRMAALAAMTAGWKMETDNSFNEEQDETLNEIRKKNQSTE